MRKHLFFTFFLILLSHSLLTAQNISEELVKSYYPNSYWLSLRLDHYLKSGSFLFIENNNRFNHTPPLGQSFPFNSIYRMYFMAGYEHKASEKWYLGLSEKLVLTPGRNSYYTRLNISHRGKIGSLKFHKEAAFEHLRYPASKNPNILVFNEGRVSFSPSLIKSFKVADRNLYLIASYRAYVLFDWVNDGFSVYDKRTIDKTRLRVEVDYFLTKHLLVSLFAIRDTDYSYQIAQYNGSGNILSPEARANRITPTFGLALNVVLNAPEDYLPGFPMK